MSDDPIVVSTEGGIAQVMLNRPEKRNALTPQMIVRLADTWDAISADPTIRVVVLSGAGEKAFCAGADLGRLTPLLTRARAAEDEWDERLLATPKLLNKALLRGTEFEIPIVGVLQGTVVAGGMELALACDIRVAASNASFGLTEVRRGLIPAGGGIARVSRQISSAVAAEILLVGDMITAERALAVGLVNVVVDPDDLSSAAASYAERMSQNGPLAMRMAKRAMLASSGTTLAEAFGVEDECVKTVLRSSDAKEGSRAFIEKRAPVFTGS